MNKRLFTHIKKFIDKLNAFCRVYSINNLIYISLFSVFFISCSNTKYLAKDEYLYTHTWYKWKGKKNIKMLPYKVYDIVNTGTVKTNFNFLLMSRPGLFFYNHIHPSKEWGFRHYIWSVLGKPPVLLSSVNTKNRLQKIRQSLFDRGHFDSEVDLRLKYYGRHKKKVKAIYSITFKDSYKFKRFGYYAHKSKLDQLIQNSLKESLIKPGDEYWVKTIKDERQRITDYLRNKGYFFFKPNYLIFDMDTTVGLKKIDAAIRIKNNIKPEYKKAYKINKVQIFFDVKKDSIQHIPLIYDSLYNVYYQEQDFYKQKYINRIISLKDDSIFKLDNHNYTLNYMTGLGIFKISEILYTKDSSLSDAIDAHIFLSPRKPITTALEVNFATKSNDFVGPFALLSYSHDNIFKGAEKLSLQLNGGFEWQKKSKRKEYDLGFNSYEIGSKIMLEFPRFLLPFPINYNNKKYIPKTYTTMGFRALKRVKYYLMSVSNANFGYKWKPNDDMSIKVEPITFNYIKTSRMSQEFKDYLEAFPSVSRSFDEQLIVGSSYNFTIQRRSKKNILKNFYNSISLDLAGNLVNLFASQESKLPNATPDQLFNANYSQYFRISNDFRYYLKLSPKSHLVTRLIGGIGVPYNKSTVLPYIKQFFAGGSNDLRAFYARSIGPGSYKKDDTSQSIFLDQSGEIKIAGNIEYRFPIIQQLNGALFMDAGNVWLLYEDKSRTGGQFKANSFLKEIAVGAGFGLRINLDFVVIRLDAAIPFRKPYQEYGKYWTFSSPHFISDYILSFAIGYPF